MLLYIDRFAQMTVTSLIQSSDERPHGTSLAKLSHITNNSNNSATNKPSGHTVRHSLPPIDAPLSRQHRGPSAQGTTPTGSPNTSQGRKKL